MDIEKLNISELSFQYAVCLEDFKRIYAKKKEFEEEFSKRYKVKMQESIRTQGEHGIAEQIKEEGEQLNDATL